MKVSTRLSLADLLADPRSSETAIIATSPLAVVSYQSLAEQIERLSGQMINAGLKPGDCVAIVLPNSLEFLIIFLALTDFKVPNFIRIVSALPKDAIGKVERRELPTLFEAIPG